MTKGNAEPVPEYWNIVQAAKYLGVKPWELIEQPIYWFNVAMICMSAESELQQKQQEKANRKRPGR